MNKRADFGNERRRWSNPRSGCRTPPTGSSRRRRACSRAPRACTTGRRTAARSSTAARACGASTPAIAGRRSSRRSRSRRRRWISRRPSRWAIRSRSSSPSALRRIAPEGFTRVFFTNSGSESADTALKIALAYHRARGEGQRFRLIGRERGYHGVNFGGMAVGGIPANRRCSAPAWPGVRPHPPHARPRAKRFLARPARSTARSSPTISSACARCTIASTIAAVIVEPVAGSAGVLVPPQGYLQRLREICTKHGILLIFDEVITGFGRLGKPFGSQRFGVMPDLFTIAKGMTNGTVPMGAVFVKDSIYEAFMKGARGHRALPRLHLLRPSARLRRGHRHARHLRGGRPARRAASRWRSTGRTACTR